MGDGIGGFKKSAGHPAVGVAVDPVGPDGSGEPDDRVPVGCAGGFGAIVPGCRGDEDPDATAVEIRHDLLQAGEAAGQVAGEVSLVAVINADVGINIPDQHAVDAAVAAHEVVEVFVDGVFPGDWGVEIPGPDHNLGVG